MSETITPKELRLAYSRSNQQTELLEAADTIEELLKFLESLPGTPETLGSYTKAVELGDLLEKFRGESHD